MTQSCQFQDIIKEINFDQVLLDGLRDGLCPSMELQLFLNVADIVAYGFFADKKGNGNR